MKVLLLGDRFMTTQVLENAIRTAFEGSGVELEFSYLTDNWPIDPVMKNDEVCEYCGDEGEILPLIRDAEILMTHTGCITSRVIGAAEKLRVIGVGRGGPVNINVKACTERGIPVMYAPGRNAGAVAEFTVGMMLAMTRNIVSCHESFHGGKKWRGDMYAYSYIGNELSESTVGLIGFGAIGSKVTKILKAFGSRVLVYDPYIPDEQKRLHACEFVGLNELLTESDIVSLHARYTKETAKMIGQAQIGLMKESAVLINTARGELVDHDALYAALKSRRIAGAALDIFEAEPPEDDSPLFSLPNVIATTHLAGASKQAAHIGAQKAAQGVLEIITGKKPVYCANPEVLK